MRGPIAILILALCPLAAVAQEAPVGLQNGAEPTTSPERAVVSLGGQQTQSVDGGSATEPSASLQRASASDGLKLKWDGTVEAMWAYSLGEPSNGVINGRYYDMRHNVPGLQGALLTNSWDAGDASGSIQLQFGSWSEQFWGPDRSLDQDLLWRILQEATAKWTAPVQGLSFEGGVYNTPFGPEYNAAYLNWNWSTSNLFALMPYQIGGFRVNYELGSGWRIRGGVYNGWDKVVTDNNGDKSAMFSLEWDDPADEGNYVYISYMVGNERARTDRRGAHARHTLDVYGQWHATPRLHLRGHVLTGVENTDLSEWDGWFGAAAFAKYDATDWLYLSVRADAVRGFAGSQGVNWLYASYLSQPSHSSTVVSGTLTLAVQTAKHATLRLEARQDMADFNHYFAGVVPRDASGRAVANAKAQTTFSLGLATWF